MDSYIIQFKLLTGIESGLYSHSIFGNICWQIKELNESLFQQLYDAFKNEHPLFILSSIFPCISKENIYFFPMTLLKPISSDYIEPKSDKKYRIDLIKNLKKFSSIKWITLPVLEHLISKKNYEEIFTETSFIQNFTGDEITTRYVAYNNFLFTGDEISKISPRHGQLKDLSTQIDIQKNAINRFFTTSGKSGAIYYTTEWYFHPIFDLFLLCNAEQEGIEILDSAFKLLEDSGLGGNKSSGKGQIEYRGFRKFTQLNSDSGTEFCTLSRYVPASNEVQPSYYKVITLRPKSYGFSGNPWKSKLKMFEEGSVFQVKENKDHFGICPVVSNFNGIEIIEYGLAYPIFFGD